jgi:hypothetical protein
MEYLRYENENMLRIEALLEKLSLHFNGAPEEAEIQKCLISIRKNDDSLKGGDFL